MSDTKLILQTLKSFERKLEEIKTNAVTNPQPLTESSINWLNVYKAMESCVEEVMVAYPNSEVTRLLRNKLAERLQPLLARMNGGDLDE